MPNAATFSRELLTFTFKEARACVFPALFMLVLAVSRMVPAQVIARYDFIFLATVGVQLMLVCTGVESRQEALVLAAFHGIGLVLELFKTHPAIGSWSYPEPGLLKVGGVPLYSGFMYAAVASYMCQAWRILDLELSGYPPYQFSVPLCIAIYLNFFTHHVLPDLRWVLLAAVLLVFRNTRVHFTVIERRRAMPLVLAFLLIGFFIWVAENASTYLGAWVYPDQRHSWQWVSIGKISSWFLLVIISFLIVADLKHVRARRSAKSEGPGTAAANIWLEETGA
ncbi:MAG: DUF817 domain-containing protein [Actinomycetota bacterium]